MILFKVIGLLHKFFFIDITTDGWFQTNVCEKCDYFNFPLLRSKNSSASAFDVFISQLKLHACVCSHNMDFIKRDCSLHKNRINWDEKEKQLNGHYLSFTIPLMNKLTYSICLETYFLVLRSLNTSIVFMTCMLIDYICIYYILSDIFLLLFYHKSSRWFSLLHFVIWAPYCLTILHSFC